MSDGSARAGRAWFSPAFLAAAIMLVVAAMGLRPAIGALARHYGKLPIGVRKSLESFDQTRLPSFRPATGPIALAFVEGDIETDDSCSVVVEPVADGAGTGANDQLMLFVTYYSDPRNQIPHTPEVCYRQGGAVIQSMRTVTVPTPGLAPETTAVDARLLDIDNFGVHTVLLYVFVSNGRFYHDREAVRFAIGWPGDRYTYFSKVEAITTCPRGTTLDEAVQRCETLLAEALPILVEDHYPRREDLARR